MKTTVWCTTSFEGFHRWPEAPEWCAYLRTGHRHIFHVKVEVEVMHNDRAVEFIHLKRQVNSFLADMDTGAQDNPVRSSCEDFALSLGRMTKSVLNLSGQVIVTVAEDNENGATVEID